MISWFRCFRPVASQHNLAGVHVSKIAHLRVWRQGQKEEKTRSHSPGNMPAMTQRPTTRAFKSVFPTSATLRSHLYHIGLETDCSRPHLCVPHSFLRWSLQLLSHTTLEECWQRPSVSLFVTSIVMMSPSSPEEGAVLRMGGMTLQGTMGRTGRKRALLVSPGGMESVSEQG